jgi:membrane-bound ClpP family serine protease
MFIWASIQAWRLVPNGVMSLYSGWLLFGFMGTFVCVFHFFEDGRLADALLSLLWIFVFVVGVVIVMQEKKLTRKQS